MTLVSVRNITNYVFSLEANNFDAQSDPSLKNNYSPRKQIINAARTKAKNWASSGGNLSVFWKLRDKDIHSYKLFPTKS